MSSSQSQGPDRKYLWMDDPKNPKVPLPVSIRQKLVFDCFELEPRTYLAGETPYDNSYLDKEVISGEHTKEWFGNEKVKLALEGISNRMALKLKLPSVDNARDLYVSVLVPRNIFNSKVVETCPVHVRFHGGGFCTGSADHSPWFPYHVRHLLLDSNAITLLPSYCKLPEHRGDELANDIKRFWDWFEDETFESAIKKVCPKVQPDRKTLLVSGESAGGFLAAWSWLSRPGLCIKAMYLQYPMLRAYAREKLFPYRGVTLDEKKVKDFAKALVDRRDLQDKGKMEKDPPRDNSIPPLGMDAAAALASTSISIGVTGQRMSTWKYLFRFPDIFDCLEYLLKKSSMEIPKHDAETKPWGSSSIMVAPSAELVEIDMEKFLSGLPKPVYCPAIFITHGKKDTNVSINDSRCFVKLVDMLFPTSDKRGSLQETEFAEHAFDYNVNEWSLGYKWLREMKDDIVSAWLAGDETKIAQIHARQAEHPSHRLEGIHTAFDVFPDDGEHDRTSCCSFDEVGIEMLPHEFDFRYQDAGSSFHERLSAHINHEWNDKYFARINKFKKAAI
ncbi:alpha/beta-hydrolase [Lophiostoma macrostomum CBS 122681]|uniref:Alpha/beta-hydrolase n=1 Tax=Lophiostoma macrostomum CBS 122681 TaxID=1314788 RepID=A0A6A6T864_9PLEO|nr:alpha/beta-hydrolase [Lophiostoma macrostomum CBS 122681]